MVTVSQLAAFDPAGWDAVSTWADAMCKQETKVQQELDSQADNVEKSWPSLVGQLAAGVLRDRATAHGELATDYDDGCTVIHTCSYAGDGRPGLTQLKTDLENLQQTVAGTPHMEGPDDNGVVTSNFQLTFPKIFDYLESMTLARQLTVQVQEVLVKADGRDREGVIELYGLLGLSLPPTTDGPVDLTDDGILLQADLNEQDRYGDCVTLSTLISLVHSDPSFVRDHMKWDPGTGTYQVTLYKDGQPVTVSVDPDKLPSDGSQEASTNKPTWLSIYEQALQQEYGDIKDGQPLEDPMARITGQKPDVSYPPASVDDIQRALDRHPPAVITTGTSGASEEQPDDVDPAKRVVPDHAYSVKGVDADGNIVLQNPWGPNGGYYDGTYYPGEVHLTPEEYHKWFGGSAVLNR